MGKALDAHTVDLCGFFGEAYLDVPPNVSGYMIREQLFISLGRKLQVELFSANPLRMEQALSHASGIMVLKDVAPPKDMLTDLRTAIT